MTTPTDDQLAAAAQKARADHETAREIAARLLAPPDPVDILAGVIADHGEVADERDELRAERDALTAELEAIRGMVGRYGHGVTAVKAVRSIVAALDEARAAGRESCATTANGYRSIAGALGILDSQASVPSILAAIADMVNKIADLSSFLSTAEADAKTQRTAAADLRAALDRVAEASGFGPDGAAPDIADRVIAEIEKLAGRPALTVERLADALRAANVTDAPSTKAISAMATMNMGDLVLPESSPTSRPAALPADLRTYLETRRDRLQGGHGLGLAAEIAALKRWIALPTAEVAK